MKSATYYALPSWDKALSFIAPADIMEEAFPGFGFALTQPQWEPSTMVDQPYCSWIQADGGTPPYIYTVSGLPLGLAVDQVTGQLTGIALARGVYQKLVFTVTDSIGAIATIQREMRVCGPDQYCNGFN